MVFWQRHQIGFCMLARISLQRRLSIVWQLFGVFSPKVNEQEREEDNQQNEAEGMSYEAPLNDHHEQHDISLNFFQSFQQQQLEKQDQNLFSQVW